MRRADYFDQFSQDLLYGVRQLARRPGLALLTILTLALGIGANAAVFSVVHGIVLNPLLYADPDRLAMIWTDSMPQNDAEYPLSAPDFQDIQARSESFEEISAVISFEWDAVLEAEPGHARVIIQHVSAPFFSMLGVEAIQGRTLGIADEQADSPLAVVVGERFWQSRYGGDPSLVGRQIVIDGEPATVVGVIPREFKFFTDADFWAPIIHNPIASNYRRSLYWLWAVGKLRPGVSVEQADAELDAITEDLERAYPDSNTGKRANVVPLHEQVTGDVRTMLLVLLGAVGFVLLIACANVASLLLGRATTRVHEMAIRNAMGATRARVIRQLLTENIVLAALGGAAGLVVGYGGVALMQLVRPDWLPRIENVAVTSPVLLFTAAIVVLAGLLFSTAPALQASRSAIAVSLAGRTGTEAVQRGRTTRDVLVVAEIALALTLLIGAGLLARSFVTLMGTDVGFEATQMLTAAVELPGLRYSEDGERLALYRTLLENAAAMPEAETVALTSNLPLHGIPTTSLTVESDSQPIAENPELAFQRVSADYFRTMHIPLIDGRTFAPEDANDTSPSAIVNEAAADAMWGRAGVIGERFRWSESEEGPWFHVVGVVGNVRQGGPDQSPPPKVYYNFEADVPGSVWLVVRTRAAPESAVASLTETIRRVDPAIVVDPIAPMKTWISGALTRPRFNTIVLGGFALLALVLTMIGVYWIINYSVAERNHELGVRIALGARRNAILTLVLGRGLMLTLLGVGLGVGGALILTRYMESMLFGIPNTDPATYFLVSMLLLATATAAAWVPARRALGVDPIEVLRTN